VLGRELVVSVAVVLLAVLGARRIDVLWVGKAGTFGLLSCFPTFLLGDEHATWARVLTDVTWVAVVPALILSFIAAAAYVPHARRALAERRPEPVTS
jgi:cardiolipin synthase